MTESQRKRKPKADPTAPSSETATETLRDQAQAVAKTTSRRAKKAVADTQEALAEATEAAGATVGKTRRRAKQQVAAAQEAIAEAAATLTEHGTEAQQALNEQRDVAKAKGADLVETVQQATQQVLEHAQAQLEPVIEQVTAQVEAASEQVEAAVQQTGERLEPLKQRAEDLISEVRSAVHAASGASEPANPPLTTFTTVQPKEFSDTPSAGMLGKISDYAIRYPVRAAVVGIGVLVALSRMLRRRG